MPTPSIVRRRRCARRSSTARWSVSRPPLTGVTPRPGARSSRSRATASMSRWDDAVVLHTHLRMSGSRHLLAAATCGCARTTRCAVSSRSPGGRRCFQRSARGDVPHARRQPPSRPRWGRPDLCRADADLGRCVELLLAYDDPAQPSPRCCWTQRAGSVASATVPLEVLWAGRLACHGGELPEIDAVRLVNVAAKLLRANLDRSEHITVPGVADGPAVYGRNASRVRVAGRPLRPAQSPGVARCTGAPVARSASTSGRRGRTRPRWIRTRPPSASSTTSPRRTGCGAFAADTLARPCVRPGSASWSSPSTRRGR